jgi:hypothetical protein
MLNDISSAKATNELSRPVVRSDVQFRELDDGGVVYDTSSERIHTLNVTAAYIWNCCDGTRTPSDIASELHQQTKIPLETAIRDVSEAITYFRNEGLLGS